MAPDAHPDGEAIDDLIERSVDAAARTEIFEVYAAMSRGHPQEPHWFLPLISVDPFVRGSGLGSALMEYGTDNTLPYSCHLHEVQGNNHESGPRSFGSANDGQLAVVGDEPR